MQELLYSVDSKKTIKEKYPTAIFKNASDCSHEECYEVQIDGITQEEFWRFVVKEGFSSDCFGFVLKMNMLRDIPKDRSFLAKVYRWLGKPIPSYLKDY